MENGPYIPTTIVHGVATIATSVAIVEGTIIKYVTQWTDEDKRLVNIDTEARSLLSMSLPDDIFHSVCHLRPTQEIWNTLFVQIEGIDSLLESRKINLVRKYEMFLKFMEVLPESWETYTMCLIMSKDIKTLSF